MRIISLFSGAGGLDLGLIQAGNTVIWANDIDKDAVATYKENIGEHIVCDDIKNIDISTLPDCDVVVGVQMIHVQNIVKLCSFFINRIVDTLIRTA